MDEFDRVDPTSTSIDAEPPVFETWRPKADTPMGQVEMAGSFARSLGPRRVKFILSIGAVIVLTFAVLSVL